MGEVIISTYGLKKIYQSGDIITSAVQNVNLTVEKGEFVGIMGPSGSGKTTLLNLLAAITPVSGGDIFYGKENITEMKEEQLCDFRRDNLGFVFQEFNLMDTLTVRENIIIALTLRGCQRQVADKRTEQVMDLLNIDDIQEKFPYQISGGQRQRCACARAIVNKPRLLLADEPTGALDSKASNELMKSFKILNENENVTILMVTHDMFCASWCQKILFMKDGCINFELIRGSKKQREFFNAIMEEQLKKGDENWDAF